MARSAVTGESLAYRIYCALRDPSGSMLKIELAPFVGTWFDCLSLSLSLAMANYGRLSVPRYHPVDRGCYFAKRRMSDVHFSSLRGV
jgi:hypothetical protein